jgi:predicted amidohydrolase YtcJ
VRAADLVIRGAPVATFDVRRPRTEAVAVRGGVLAAVGDEQEVSTLIGPGTRVIDLSPDHLVLPGFIDAHTHYVQGPLEAAGVNLSESDTLEEILAILRRVEPEDGVVAGGGWRSHIFPNGPERGLLDAIFDDTPVLLREINSHSLWVNSAALDAAGVTRDTPDPEPGYSMFVRDATGEPTGWVLEEAAMNTIREALAPFTPERARRELAAAQPRYAGAGLTGVFDAGIFLIDEQAGWEMLVAMDERGEIGQRVVAAKAALFDDDPVAALAEANRAFRSANVRVDTLKIFVDGVPEAHTSAYLDPYDDRPATGGPLATPEADIRRWTDEADAAGFACHFHAIGDRAVRVALDAVESARDRRDSGIRHTVCHCDLIDPDDLPRFARLGVVLNTSGQWIASSPVDEVMQRRLGERARRFYSLRSALAAGAIVTLGADYPASAYMSTLEPVVLIESAVTRRLSGVTDGEPLPPADEALTVTQAVRAMTTDAARQLAVDDRTGTVEEGKSADLVVLGRDIFEIPPHEIAATPVVLTIMGGRITHEGGP